MYLFLLCLTAVVFAGVVAVYLRHPASSWFHPLTIYLAFHGLVFVIRPWIGYFYDYRLIYAAYRFQPSEATRELTLVIATLGLVVFAAAALYFGRTPFRFAPAAPGLRRAARSSFLVTAAILMPLFLYSTYLGWVNRMTNKSLSTLDPSTGVQISTGTNGYVFGATNMSVFLLPLILWLFRFRPVAIAIATLLLILLFGIGTRGPTIFALACIMSFYLYEHRRPWLSPTVMLGIAASAGLFAAIGDDRGKAIRNMFTQDVSTVHSSKTAAPLERMDFANMEMLEFLVQTVPDRTGSYEYFVDQLQIFTEPIPRSLWKDKPVGQPIRFFSLYDYGYPIGITRSLPGEGWMQLGLVGVILWCGLWGWALGTIHDRYVKSRQSPFQTYAYFALMALMVVCYRDGLLLSVLRFGLFAFAPALLWYGIWRLQGNATHPPIATGASSTPAFAPGDSPAERRRRLADMAQRSSA